MALLVIAALCPAPGKPEPPHKAPQKTQASQKPKPAEHAFFTQTGAGSRYSNRLIGRKTAAGGRFSQHGFTAAHRSLPFGTIVRVTNMANGLRVKVAIEDRGPHAKGRIIDLSSAAARALRIRKGGVAKVRLQAFKTDQAGGSG